MSTIRIAIPSNNPGGLEAGVSEHFGHCDIYTLVDVRDGQAVQVSTLDNLAHEEGGCLAPVRHLAEHGVAALVAGGMGARPLQGFHQAGVKVYYGGGRRTVAEAVTAFVNNQLIAFGADQVCGGGHCGGH